VEKRIHWCRYGASEFAYCPTEVDEAVRIYRKPAQFIGVCSGFDHGVGHPLLLLYDAKTPHGQKVKEFKGLDHDPSNASISLL
jgi:hypothetical protein